MIKKTSRSRGIPVLTAQDLPVHLPAQKLDRSDPYRSLKLPDWTCTVSAVYRFYDAERRPLYIGQSACLGLRLDDHRRYARWWPMTEFIAVSLYEGQRGAVVPERTAIRWERPRFNQPPALRRKSLLVLLDEPAEDAAAALLKHAEPEFLRELAELLRTPDRFPGIAAPPRPCFGPA
ncbi:GIY-YIG nuclease family protein [Streptomyces griseofuscus]|uniref:GIY-YIG nuclease family protein n=1 Tax=Streptomyces griseofuscus TaxID=146922 RepID=UPI00340811AE